LRHGVSRMMKGRIMREDEALFTANGQHSSTPPKFV
jgi:hypothetical protein